MLVIYWHLNINQWAPRTLLFEMLKREDLKGSFHVALVDSESGGRKYQTRFLLRLSVYVIWYEIQYVVNCVEMVRSETGWNKGGGEVVGGGAHFQETFRLLRSDACSLPYKRRIRPNNRFIIWRIIFVLFYFCFVVVLTINYCVFRWSVVCRCPTKQ
jgi:hypothetical protein